MKITVTGIVGTAMILLAGCSSKNAVSTGGISGTGGNGANAAPASMVTVVNVPDVVAKVPETEVARTQDTVVIKDPESVAAINPESVPVLNQGAGLLNSRESVFTGPILGDIFFDFDSAALSVNAQDQLKQNAAWMQRNPQPAVIIEGHCDERGTDEYNIALGERRAITAKQYLVSLGFSEQRLSAVSFGEEKPFDQGHGEDAWYNNRRGHFRVVKPDSH